MNKYVLSPIYSLCGFRDPRFLPPWFAELFLLPLYLTPSLRNDGRLFVKKNELLNKLLSTGA